MQLGTFDCQHSVLGHIRCRAFFSLLFIPGLPPRAEAAWAHWGSAGLPLHCMLTKQPFPTCARALLSLLLLKHLGKVFAVHGPACLAALIMLSCRQLILTWVQRQLYLHSPRRLGAVVTTCQWSGLNSSLLERGFSVTEFGMFKKDLGG